MNTVKKISREEAEEKPLKWFREQYFLILDEFEEEKKKRAESSAMYYARNRKAILEKRKTREKAPKPKSLSARPRGRPRKYNFLEIETIVEK